MKTSPKLLLLALLLGAGSSASAQPASYTTLTANKLLDFRYSFPTLVGSHPRLLARIRADEAREHSKSLSDAREDSELRRTNGFPFHRHEFWRDWTITGRSGRLISLKSNTEFYTGGAHGGQQTSALLWDIKTDSPTSIDNLFQRTGEIWTLVRTEYCRKLGEERFRRVQTRDVSCPARKQLTIVPVDGDFDWEFDTIRIIADPYVAGSYAEGFYVVSLPVKPELIASLKPEYRDAFEAQPQ